MKKILLGAICAVLLVSCASKRAGIVDSAITEAKVLQALAKANSFDVPSADALIASAEKQKDAGQTEEAYTLADEATLQLQLFLLEKENKNMADSLAVLTESLNTYRSVLADRKKVRR